MFKFDIRKAIEAAAALVRLSPQRLIGRKRLLALLYLADRESLKRTGRPIVGGRLLAMKSGPMHAEMYHLVKGGHSDQADWSKHFSTDAHLVLLSRDPGVSALSRYEIGILNDITQRFMGYDDWDVAEATHDLAEYKRTYREDTSTAIPYDLLIDAAGLSRRKEVIARDAKEKEYFDDLFPPGHQHGSKPEDTRAKKRRAKAGKK